MLMLISYLRMTGVLIAVFLLLNSVNALAAGDELLGIAGSARESGTKALGETMDLTHELESTRVKLENCETEHSLLQQEQSSGTVKPQGLIATISQFNLAIAGNPEACPSAESDQSPTGELCRTRALLYACLGRNVSRQEFILRQAGYRIVKPALDFDPSVRDAVPPSYPLEEIRILPPAESAE